MEEELFCFIWMLRTSIPLLSARMFASHLCNISSISKVCPSRNLDLQSIDLVTGHDEELMIAILVESSRISPNSVIICSINMYNYNIHSHYYSGRILSGKVS